MKASEMRISKAQFIEMLKAWNFGAQPVSIQYITEPKLTSEGKKIFGSVTKLANVGGMVGYCYENSVNNELEREGKVRDFLSQPLWNGKGKRINLALSTHIEKNTYYLTYKAQKTFRSFHFDSALNFIPAAIIKAYFPNTKPQNQGVNEGKEIHHREISIDNVKRFKCRKITYIIEA